MNEFGWTDVVNDFEGGIHLQSLIYSCGTNALFATIAASWNMHIKDSRLRSSYIATLDTSTNRVLPTAILDIIVMEWLESDLFLTTAHVQNFAAESVNSENMLDVIETSEWPKRLCLLQVQQRIRSPNYGGESPLTLELLSRHPFFVQERLGFMCIAHKLDHKSSVFYSYSATNNQLCDRFCLLYHANNHFKLLAKVNGKQVLSIVDLKDMQKIETTICRKYYSKSDRSTRDL